MKLFEPWTLRGLTMRNRTILSPMCQYSAVDGVPNDFHLIHLGSRAMGGFGMVMTEAAAVEPAGRLCFADVGIWSDDLVPNWQRVTAAIHAGGAAACIQLAHAGRKAAGRRPWDPTDRPFGPGERWEPIFGPTAEPFSPDYAGPQPMTRAEIDRVKDAFVAGARRAIAAGFDAVEIHGAHGYLISQFLSPIVNTRSDEYGGSFAGRSRLLLETVEAVRAVLPATTPLLVRISTQEWLPDGWSVTDSVALARELKTRGVDLLDCSSGGTTPQALPPTPTPGYQTAAAARIRSEAGIATGAVGMIVDPGQAEHIIRSEQADAVLIGRAALRDPYWPLHAAHALGQEAQWPSQYLRGRPR